MSFRHGLACLVALGALAGCMSGSSGFAKKSDAAASAADSGTDSSSGIGTGGGHGAGNGTGGSSGTGSGHGTGTGTGTDAGSGDAQASASPDAGGGVPGTPVSTLPRVSPMAGGGNATPGQSPSTPVSCGINSLNCGNNFCCDVGLATDVTCGATPGTCDSAGQYVCGASPPNCGNICCSPPGVCNNGVCVTTTPAHAPGCAGSYPVACGSNCCLAGATCTASGCGCPPDAPNACSGVCCPGACGAMPGTCQSQSCGSSAPVTCAEGCCLPGAACNAGLCDCPVGEAACGDGCCPAGAACDGTTCLSCPADYPVPCGPSCCDSNSVCTSMGCLPADPNTSGANSEHFDNGSFSGASLGNVTLASGCQYSVSASGVLTMTIKELTDGTVNGTATATVMFQITATYSPPNTTCSASSFTLRDPTGPVSGSDGTMSAALSSTSDTTFQMQFAGMRTADTITGAATLNISLHDNSGAAYPLSGSTGGLVLTKQ